MDAKQEWCAAYVAHARSEAKSLTAMGKSLGRCNAASNFHDRAANLETAALILSGERAGVEHHVSGAIKIIERGGVA